MTGFVVQVCGSKLLSKLSYHGKSIIWLMCECVLSCRGQIKLADFGLARLYNSERGTYLHLRATERPDLIQQAGMICVNWADSDLSCAFILQSAVHQ